MNNTCPRCGGRMIELEISTGVLPTKDSSGKLFSCRSCNFRTIKGDK